MIGFNCILQLTKSTPTTLIKQLVLFYDEVYCIVPEFSGIEPNAWLKAHGGEWEGKQITPINYISDGRRMIHAMFEGMQWDDLQMPEVIRYLQERKIIKIAQDCVSSIPTDVAKNFSELSKMMLYFDVRDPLFNRLTNTKPQDYKSKVYFMELKSANEFPEDQSMIPPKIPMIVEPTAIARSLDISNSLYYAETLNAFPVYDDTLKPLLQYRYRKAKQGVKALKSSSLNINLPLEERDKFGDIVFCLSNELFQSRVFKALDIKEIVRYRDANEEQRKKFLSTNMVELLGLIDSGPWTEDLHKEVTKYVRTKLIAELERFNDRSTDLWEKMEAKIIAGLAKSAERSLAGLAIGGISGNVLPNTSPWEMVLLGALGAAATTAPDLVKDISDSIVEMRSHKRNSVAYLAQLRSSTQRTIKRRK